MISSFVDSLLLLYFSFVFLPCSPTGLFSVVILRLALTLQSRLRPQDCSNLNTVKMDQMAWNFNSLFSNNIYFLKTHYYTLQFFFPYYFQSQSNVWLVDWFEVVCSILFPYSIIINNLLGQICYKIHILPQRYAKICTFKITSLILSFLGKILLKTFSHLNFELFQCCCPNTVESFCCGASFL